MTNQLVLVLQHQDIAYLDFKEPCRWEFLKLTDLECVNLPIQLHAKEDSQDSIYDNMPELESYVNKKSFSTDEDSDGEYS